jgi:GxxExxY protein
MASSTIAAQPRINRITGVIVNAAMKVHSVLGPGLLESAYQACLAHELRKRGLLVASQVGLPVEYEGERIELGYRMDLVIENTVVVEVKCVRGYSPRPRSPASIVSAPERYPSRVADQLSRRSPARWNQAHGRWLGLAERLTTGDTEDHRGQRNQRCTSAPSVVERSLPPYHPARLQIFSRKFLHLWKIPVIYTVRTNFSPMPGI